MLSYFVQTRKDDARFFVAAEQRTTPWRWRGGTGATAAPGRPKEKLECREERNRQDRPTRVGIL